MALASLVAGPAAAEAPGVAVGGVHEVSAAVRKKLGLVVVEVGSGQLELSLSEVIAEVGRLTEKHTDLRLELLPDEQVRACQTGTQGLFSCFASRIRPDFDPTDPEHKKRPYGDYLEELRARKLDYVHHLVILSVVGDATAPDRISAILLDTDRAMRLLLEARDADEAESRINEEAIAARLPRTDVGTPRELTAFFKRMLSEEFRREFERSGNWEPFGTVEFKVAEPGLEIALDGRPLGVAQPGLNRLVAVSEGDHALTLTNPDFEPFATNLTVVPRDVVTFEPSLRRVIPGMVSGLRAGTFWGGAAIAGAGVGLMVATAVAMNTGEAVKDLRIYCFGASPDCGSRFWTERVFSTQPKSPGADPNDGALLMIPLGYSLVGMGATMALGTELLTEEEEIPWIPMAVGVGVGAISYGLSALLNPSNPFAGSTAQSLQVMP